MTGPVLWVDATAGASGDMLLGALVDAGVGLPDIAGAVEAVVGDAVTLREESVSRGGLRALRVHVEVSDRAHRRTWREIRTLLETAALDEGTRTASLATFEALARAEGAVHAIDPEDVHFHEVGALDSLADIVGVCRGFTVLAPSRVVVSPIAVGSGRVGSAHGSLPVPVPAVAELLRARATTGGPGEGEACTPTGAALLVSLGSEEGALPAMRVERIGVGAGGRDPGTHPNVVRILAGRTGEEARTDGGLDERPWVLETNVDDLDPRIWPDVLAGLLGAGASDAWLTPILMKKGRPAHTLSVLTSPETADRVRDEIFRQTSTIGLRETRVSKTALEREMTHVDVGGEVIGVKVARLRGAIVNAQPEYADVSRAATVLGLPVKEILARAIAQWHQAAGDEREGHD